VGTGGDGVFVSDDEGSIWTPLNDGLGNLNINKLAISKIEPKTLLAGTAYGGVWSLNLEEIPCVLTGDLNLDGDVDGSDLAAYIGDQAGISLSDFAAEFGKNNCP
jgi:hypothetical protein